MGWMCPYHKKDILESWPTVHQNETLLGDRVFIDKIKLKCSHSNGPQSPVMSSWRRGNVGTDADTHTVVCKPGRKAWNSTFLRALSRNRPCQQIGLWLPASRTERLCIAAVCVTQPLGLGCFVTAALGDWDRREKLAQHWGHLGLRDTQFGNDRWSFKISFFTSKNIYSTKTALSLFSKATSLLCPWHYFFLSRLGPRIYRYPRTENQGVCI